MTYNFTVGENLGTLNWNEVNLFAESMHSLALDLTPTKIKSLICVLRMCDFFFRKILRSSPSSTENDQVREGRGAFFTGEPDFKAANRKTHGESSPELEVTPWFARKKSHTS